MMRFTLPTGRNVEMQGLHILSTRHAANAAIDPRAHQREVLARFVEQLYPEGNVPHTIVWAADGSMPRATCVATFTPSPLEAPEGEGFSCLVACWFVHHVERSVANIVCEGLSRLEWEENARDFPWW